MGRKSILWILIEKMSLEINFVIHQGTYTGGNSISFSVVEKIFRQMSKSCVSGESISGRRPINVISVGKHAVKGDIFRFTHESI